MHGNLLQSTEDGHRKDIQPLWEKGCHAGCPQAVCPQRGVDQNPDPTLTHCGFDPIDVH